MRSSCILVSLSVTDSPHWNDESEGHARGREGTNLSAVRVVLKRCQSARHVRLIPAILTPVQCRHFCLGLDSSDSFDSPSKQTYPPANDEEAMVRSGNQKGTGIWKCVMCYSSTITTKRYRRIRDPVRAPESPRKGCRVRPDPGPGPSPVGGVLDSQKESHGLIEGSGQGGRGKAGYVECMATTSRVAQLNIKA
jgi:hypothetical protein